MQSEVVFLGISLWMLVYLLMFYPAGGFGAIISRLSLVDILMTKKDITKSGCLTPIWSSDVCLHYRVGKRAL